MCLYYYLPIIDGDRTAIVSSRFDILFFPRRIAHFPNLLSDCFVLYFSGQLDYTKFKESAQTLFIESIVEAAGFKFHNTEYEPVKSVGNLSREIMKNEDTRDSNVKDYIDFLSNFIYNISFSGFKDSDKEIMFKKFYRFSVGDESLCNG